MYRLSYPGFMANMAIKAIYFLFFYFYSVTQNITRDIKIKNNVTIARGEWGGDSGRRGL